jgi:uncharacterized protein DUF6979
MGQHGRIAHHVVRRVVADGVNPETTWAEVAAELYGNSPALQMHGSACSTFLGLCAAGFVVGVPVGEYQHSARDKNYGLEAVKILGEEPTLVFDQDTLWRHVLKGRDVRHNAQMDVVCTLYRANLIKSESD